VLRGDAVEYGGTPELMSTYARLARDAGARIIGGCCGTSAAHLCAMRDALDGHVVGRLPAIVDIEIALGPIARPKSDAPRERRTRRER
jgi:5-methyltetrahydrofolate--homocysteine methyltransferase